MQCVALQVVDIKDCGWPSQVCPLGTHLPGASPCTVPGLWGPGVPPQAVTVALFNSCPYLNLQHLLLSIL